MAEGRHYKVGWQRTTSGWRVWLHARPEIAAEVASLDDAWMALHGPVCRALGDGEPLFSFHPPVPAANVDQPFLTRRLAILVNHAYAWIKGNVSDYFHGPICTQCYVPAGPRNDRRLEESAPPEGDLCHRNQSDFGPVIASERFVRLLSNEERGAVELRAVVRSPRARKAVYEVIPKVVVPPTHVLGNAKQPYRCATCGTVRITHELEGSTIRTFVADSAFDRGTPSVFGVGTPWRFKLALPFDRAVQIAAHPHARGAGAAPLGTTPSHLIDPAPQITDWVGESVWPLPKSLAGHANPTPKTCSPEMHDEALESWQRLCQRHADADENACGRDHMPRDR